MADFDFVTDDLAVGGSLSDRDPAGDALTIRDAGIRLVIDMRAEWTDFDIWREVVGVQYISVPTHDVSGSHLSSDAFDAVVMAARSAAALGEKVLVHCHMGINRGPSAAMAVLLDRGLSPEDAFDTVRKRSVAAVYYAMDALEAHQRRNRYVSTKKGADERKRLKQHIKAAWTNAEQRRIAHIIKERHNFDLRRVIP